MRNIFKKIILLGLISFYSCEEVIDIELEESEPRLVVEATILKNKDGSVSSNTIKLSTTAPFFDENIPPVTEAQITISDESGRIYIFEEIEPGYYKNSDLDPVPGVTYELELIYQQEIYKATETFIEVPSIEYIAQNDNGGIGGDDIELRAFYRDPPEPGNYYLFRFFHEDLTIQIYDDELINGNITFAYFSTNNLSSGDQVGFEIQGISQRFYEYMFILRSQSGAGGGPFQTQPTTVRGNLVNTTNPDNYALGFFRLSETDFYNYFVE